MKIIAFANQKGGVGKSSLAIHTAVEMQGRGLRVAILDLDAQGSAVKWRRRRDKDEPLVVSVELAQLASLLAQLNAEDYDYVFLDLPGRRAPSVTQGIKAADLMVIPTRPLDMDVEAAGETVAVAQRLRKPYAFAMSIAPPGERTRQYAAALRAHGHPVLRTVVADRLTYPDAIAEGLGISEYEPKGAPAKEIRAFANELLEAMK
jgi:chromosome partitioning protein